jgi:RNA polymerase sigma-70 factor, ECF subfamily
MPDPTFIALVDRYYPALYRFAFSLVRCPADAGDLVQQTFLIWARKSETLRDPTKAKTWLFTTLYREFLQSRRDAGRNVPWNDLNDCETAAGDDVEPSFSITSDELVDAIEHLDINHRTPLVLHYLDELSYQEIAAALEIPIGTVMSRLHRGKAQLRQLLHDRGRPQLRGNVPKPGGAQ